MSGQAGEMCPDCGRFVAFLNRDTLRCSSCPDPADRLRAIAGGAHDCPDSIDFSHRNLQVITAAGAAPTTPASTPIAPSPHKEKDRSA